VSAWSSPSAASSPSSPARRPPAPATDGGPRALARLWGGVALALVALAPWAPALAARLPACPVRALTGWPCPTCGATRAALELARFDVAAALAWNPLAAAGWILLVAGGLGAALASFVLPLPAEPRALSVPARFALVGALAANWAYLLWVGR
jgi:hypothetical protein